MTALIPGDHDFATSAGSLHYHIAGTGPACVALGGGPGIDPRYLEHLGGITDCVTFITLHLHGSGRSPAPNESDWSLAAYARDARALCQHLGLERPLVLGHSHGGWVAQRYALDFPDETSGLLLVDTAPAGPSALNYDPTPTIERYRGEPWFERAYAALETAWDQRTTPEQASAILAEVMPFYFARLTPDVQAYLSRVLITVNPAPHVYGNGREQFRADWRAQLPRLQIPALVMVGRYDFIQTLPMAEEMTQLIPHAQLAIFEESGHFPWIEERERFHRIVRDFVASLAS